jgi:putative hydrolase of HD superfamily
MEPHLQGMVDIAKLVSRFAKVNRVTLHEDGETLESDTDHTVMLALCACSVAEKFYPHLDLGKVAQFATVHDLVEAYAGDTDTFNISAEGRKEKEEREAKSLQAIEETLKDSYPWIARTIREYESLESKEAQFVKMMDKLMTKLTHMTNEGAQLKKTGKTKEETMRHYGTQTQTLEEKYGKDFPEVISMLKHFTNKILETTYA